jgi:hypothetical protein
VCIPKPYLYQYPFNHPTHPIHSFLRLQFIVTVPNLNQLTPALRSRDPCRPHTTRPILFPPSKDLPENPLEPCSRHLNCTLPRPFFDLPGHPPRNRVTLSVKDTDSPLTIISIHPRCLFFFLVFYSLFFIAIDSNGHDSPDHHPVHPFLWQLSCLRRLKYSPYPHLPEHAVTHPPWQQLPTR